MPNVLEGPVSYRSQLVRRLVSSGVQPRAGVCVPLHSEGADEGQLLPLCRAVAPELEVFAPQAPRSRNPLLSSGNSRGWSAYRGYSWYRSDGPRPEPASFGDSLWQLDQFTLDLGEARASENPPILLLGYREGACLALATAVVAPERFEGVVAIAGLLPELPGWELPATYTVEQLEVSV